MSLWENNRITNIDIGVTPNDGSGDNIRDAFNKVDTNFANISTFLRSSDTIDFTKVNVTSYFGAEYANITNMYVANATGTTSSFTGNSTTGNLIANTGIYSNGSTHINGNLYITGHIVPAGSGQYDLGSASNPFRAVYANITVTGGTIQTSDAGQIVVHANSVVGDVKDVGILGNVTHHYSSNTYAYFGYQYQTNNFVYKISNTDPTKGNGVVYDGIYGNAQLGGLFLSNSTVSTSTSTGALIVAGGTGVTGNLYVGGNAVVTGNATVSGNVVATGNVYSNGALILTSSTIGYYGSALTGGIVLGSARYQSSESATSPTTGAIAITTGGLGVVGNIYSGAGFYGNLTGTVLTAAQPNITTVGQLNGLSVNGTSSTTTLQATTVGTTNMTVTGTIDLTGATINGAAFSSFPASGNITAGTLAGGFVGNIYGNVLIASQPYITTLSNPNTTVSGNLSVTGNNTVLNGAAYANNFSTANAQITGGNVTAMNTVTTTGVVTNFSTANAQITGGNVTAMNTVTTTGVITNFSTANAQITGGNIAAGYLVATNFSTGNAQITGGNVTAMNTVTTTGVVTHFSSSNVRVSGGYLSGLANITATTSNIVSMIANTVSAATIGNTGALITGSGLTINNTTVGSNVSIAANANVTISANTTAGSGIYITGNILPSANISYNIGSTTNWFNTFYGVSSQARYADLAELYTSDAEYTPGTVVIFGGEAEITTTTTHADARVAGAISTDPAYLMNAAETGLPVALRGRVPVKVLGAVRKGDSLVTAATPGYATSVGTSTQFAQAVFAKSIETDLDPGEKVIIAVIL